MFARWVNTATVVTAVRYALQALGGILIANGKLDAGAWETISGAILVVLPLLLGVKATATPKVVTPDGTTVTLKKMTASEKKEVVTNATAAAERKPTLFDRLFNRK